MDEIESVLHELGIAFAGGLARPGSMRASLVEFGHQSQTYDAAGDPALIGSWGGSSGTDVYALMDRLRSAVGVDGPFVVELTGSPDGDYVIGYRAGGDSGRRMAPEPIVVFDADYRFPGHPRPGMARPAAAANDGRPTDPAALAEVRSLVEQFTAEHLRLEGKPPRFAPGYDEAEILAAEGRLGVRLPEDVRALYRVIHDDNGESGLLGRFSPMPLERVVEWHREGDPGTYGDNDGLFEDTPVVFETAPHGHVRRVSRSDWWVTFAPDYGMNSAALDLDPAGSGRYGQILMYGRDVWGPIVHVAPSVRHVMRAVVASMRAAAPGDEWDWRQPEPPRHEWSVDVGGADLADLVADATDPAAIQAVHLRRVDRVRLTDLAGLPRLRAIRVLDVRQRAGHVDLSIPPGLPVEQVDVTAGHFAPERLAGTPTLRYVTLAGNTAPVRVAALAALPELVRLDLSGAAVADIASVAMFPALKVLTLGPAQWRELLDTGWTPERLAAVRLGGREAVAQAAAWHAAISGGSRSPLLHHTIRGPR